MATGDIAPVNGLANISSLLEMINGKSSSSTTKSNISKEGVDALLQQILGGTQGLASVAGGQKSAGLYNSTTNQQLINDLITRSAGEVAKLQAGTTTTNKVAPQVTGGNILATVGANYAKQLLSPTMKGVAKKAGLDTWGDKLADMLGVGTGAQAGAIADSVAAGTTAAGADVAGFTALEAAGNAGAGALAGDFLTSLGIDTSSTAAAASGIADAVSTGTLAGGADVAGFAALESAGVDAAASTGADFALGSFNPGGPIVSYAITEGIKDKAPELALQTVAEAGKDIGDLAVETVDNIGNAVGWVICTELNAQGKLDDELYVASAARALTLSDQLMRGYHAWAIPVTKWMRKSPTLSSILFPVAKARCEYLLGNFNITGWLTVVVGEPICSLIGKVVSKKQNWEKLYG